MPLSDTEVADAAADDNTTDAKVTAETEGTAPALPESNNSAVGSAAEGTASRRTRRLLNTDVAAVVTEADDAVADDAVADDAVVESAAMDAAEPVGTVPSDTEVAAAEPETDDAVADDAVAEDTAVDRCGPRNR